MNTSIYIIVPLASIILSAITSYIVSAIKLKKTNSYNIKSKIYQSYIHTIISFYNNPNSIKQINKIMDKTNEIKSPLLLYAPDSVIVAYCEIDNKKDNIEEYLNSIANLIYEMRIDIGIIKNPKKLDRDYILKMTFNHDFIEKIKEINKEKNMTNTLSK